MAVEQALAAEGNVLVMAIASMSNSELDRPTRCVPWDVKTLAAHVVRGTQRACEILSSAGGGIADPDPLVYYRSPLRSNPERAEKRSRAAAETAAQFLNAEQVSSALAAAVDGALDGLRRLGKDTVVTTHWGPVMRLEDYLRTRVLELAVHGLDLADALDRPFDGVDAMNRALIDNWNETVAENDTVWVVGDFALEKIAETLPIAAGLHGPKILLAGNHDRSWEGHSRQAETCIDSSLRWHLQLNDSDRTPPNPSYTHGSASEWPVDRAASRPLANVPKTIL